MKLNGKQMMAIRNAVGSNGSPDGFPYIKVKQGRNGYNIYRKDELIVSIEALKKEATFSTSEGESILNAVIEYWSEV